MFIAETKPSHRVVDGAPTASFLNTVTVDLENSLTMLL